MDRVDYQSMIVQDLINDQRDEKIHLNPWYQRRSVWTRSQKSYLINTLMERKPIPALYIRHSIDVEKGVSIKEIVDGQQRARSIIEFCAGQFTTQVSLERGRKSFDQLSAAEKEFFLLTPIPVGFLIGATDNDVIDIFARINSVSKSLNSQEQRNAKFSGDFKQFCIEQSVARLAFWRSTGIFSANDIARMNEVLFISDLVLNLTNGLSDFRPSDLDTMYRENDDLYPNADVMRAKLNRIFDVLYDIDRSLISDTIFVRPPLLFSLILIIDSENLTAAGASIVIREVDAAFHDPDLTTDEVIGFRQAVSASLQRISSRQARDAFLRARIP
jgi:Protein of unknown function DUF262